MSAAATIIRLQNLVSLSVSHIALNPVITASLLWILTKGPESVKEFLVSRSASLRDPVRFAKIVRTLKTLLVVGLLGKVNKQLNTIALNAWRLKSEKKRWKLTQEIAVVTGGCSGIGELTVKGLWKKSVKIVILDIQDLPSGLQNTGNIHYFKCDITDPAAVRETAKRIQATVGTPSILINNAGIGGAHAILDTSDEYLRKIFDVNLLSNWYTVKAFLPDMIAKNKGHIVTIASTASYAGVAGMVDYTATKAGVLAFHEGLNQELRLRYHAPNVLTTSIHPNWVKTPLIGEWETALRVAQQPIIEPQVVADAVVKQIASATGGQVFLPNTVSTVSHLRGLPNWFQEAFRATVGSVIVKSLK
ncbi:dehydrogenase/reductase SDR family member 8 precursor [Westerdykella ornata]|uniref:Short-chain dehydrogenase/reductase 3 n=1 Tax=Westerdykella ornata TaxID=318751 RepID=A0A6A6JDB2_WESOR|nr:dehydrogenase/reductase SDR family member 8 precursor [Westerdykella ornata]KAF2274224.1 dehydrogenase/reductase SDR family member 8 precursor [Westerdykella ornata]